MSIDIKIGKVKQEMIDQFVKDISDLKKIYITCKTKEELLSKIDKYSSGYYHCKDLTFEEIGESFEKLGID